MYVYCTLAFSSSSTASAQISPPPQTMVRLWSDYGQGLAQCKSFTIKALDLQAAGLEAPHGLWLGVLRDDVDTATLRHNYLGISTFSFTLQP